MKTIDAITAYQAVQKLIDTPQPKTVAFSYALVRNKRVLEPIVQQYNAALAIQRDPHLDALLALWRNIAPRYAQRVAGVESRDVNGNIIIDPAHIMEYNNACEQIMIEDADHVAAFQRRTELINDLQGVEIDIDDDIYPIALSIFPVDTDFTTINLLYPLIEKTKRVDEPDD